MCEDRSDALVLTLRFADGRGQRLVVEPCSEDPRAKHTLVDKRLTNGGSYRTASTDALDAVGVENAPEWADDRSATVGRIRELLDDSYPLVSNSEAGRRLREAAQLCDVLEVRP